MTSSKRRQIRQLDRQIEQVRDVVQGERRLALTGWQRDAAIEAMVALGQGTIHIGWALRCSQGTAEKWARQLGLRPHLLDQRLDHLGIWIAVHGGRIALRGADRDEAIRRLARAGLTPEEIARRLFVRQPSTVSQAALRLGIEVVHPQAWPSEKVSFLARQRSAEPLEDLIAA